MFIPFFPWKRYKTRRGKIDWINTVDYTHARGLYSRSDRYLEYAQTISGKLVYGEEIYPYLEKIVMYPYSNYTDAELEKANKNELGHSIE